MAITLTTSPQIVGRNEGSTIKTYLYAWYDGQSGNSCTVHTRLTCKCVGTTYTGTNKSYFMRLGGYDSGIIQWGYAPLNDGQEYTVAEASWSYSGGNQIAASAGFWTYVFGSADVGLADAVYVPVFNSPPTGLSVSVAEVYTNGAKFNTSISSYGTPSGASGRYIEASILAQNSYGPSYRFNTALNTTSSQITVTNSSYVGGTLVIQPNTRYWFGAYATNTAMNASKIQGQFVTKAVAPTIQFVEATPTTATLSYSLPADGGAYDRTIQYAIGGTWKTVTTATGGSAKTGVFVIEGLLSGASYTIRTRVSTTAGTTDGADVSFDTLVSEEDNVNRFYGSVSGVSKEITRLYGEVSGEGKHIVKLYGTVPDPDSVYARAKDSAPIIESFDPEVFKQKMIEQGVWNQRNEFKYLQVWVRSQTDLSLGLNMGSFTLQLVPIGGAEADINSFGVYLKQNFPTSGGYDYLYFQPAGRTKLIHQAVGHIDYS